MRHVMTWALGVCAAALTLVAAEPPVDVNLAASGQLASAGLNETQVRWIVAHRPWTPDELAASAVIPAAVRDRLTAKSAERGPWAIGSMADSAGPNVAAQQRDLVWHPGARPVCADVLLQVFGPADGPCPGGRSTLPLDEARARGYRDQR